MRLAADPHEEILYRDVHQPLAAFLWSPADVRRDDAVFRLEQRVIRADGFIADDIQPGGKHLSAVERIRQALLHEERAAAVVEQDDAVLHLRDGAGVDNPHRLREQRAVQADLKLIYQFFVRY